MRLEEIWQSARAIHHAHPSLSSWVQGIGSLLAVVATAVVFIVQNRNRLRERREDDQLRRNLEEKAARQAELDRHVRLEGLLITIWPLMIQTRSQISRTLATLRNSERKPPFFAPEPEYYAAYEIGGAEEWVRVEKEIFVLGGKTAIPIYEMLAIVRQYDRDFIKLERRKQPIDYERYSVFLGVASQYADTATNELEMLYRTALGQEPKRAKFWAQSAVAAMKQAKTMGRQ